MDKPTNKRLRVIASWIAVVLLMFLIFRLLSQAAEESDELIKYRSNRNSYKSRSE